MTNRQEMFDRITENILKELEYPDQVELRFCSSDEEFLSAGDDIEIAACYNMNTEIFSSLSGLKWISFGATGVDGILFPELIQSDIVLTKAVGFHSKVTAEHAVSMMLYFEKKFSESIKFMNTKKWNQSEIAKQNGTLAGKTLGILGFGAVGQSLAEIAKVLGMKVLVVSRNSRSDSVLPNVDKVYPLNELEELISLADYFIICVPLTNETRGIIDETKLSRMKESAVLINVARGDILDENALIAVLSQNKIAGAGLDVFSTEPLPEESPLFDLDNVFLSPHVAGNFADYTPLAATDFGKNLKRYLKGEKLINIVDKERGY